MRSRGKIDAETWDDLEEALIRADVGVGATDALLDDLRRPGEGEARSPVPTPSSTRSRATWWPCCRPATPAWPTSASPEPRRTGRRTARGQDAPVDVWLFVGVNGVGKTTTVGKVASRLSARRVTTVLLAAGDTFRAAAGEQLAMWAVAGRRGHRPRRRGR